jgi:hypothetical protein
MFADGLADSDRAGQKLAVMADRLEEGGRVTVSYGQGSDLRQQVRQYRPPDIRRDGDNVYIRIPAVHPVREYRCDVLYQGWGRPEVFVDNSAGSQKGRGNSFLKLARCHDINCYSPRHKSCRKVRQEGLRTADDRAFQRGIDDNRI